MWMTWRCSVFVFFIIKINGEKVPETMSVEIDAKSPEKQDFIQILDPPNVVYNDMEITIYYMCSRARIVGIEVLGIVDKSQRTMFRRAWKCGIKYKSEVKRKLKIKFANNIAYRPDLFNRYSTHISKPKLRAWSLDSNWWPNARKFHNAFWRSSVKVVYDTEIISPYSRPSKGGVTGCIRWPYQILSEMFYKIVPQCPYENEIVNVVTYPVALNGLQYGVIRKFEKFMDPNLEFKRQKMLSTPIFTVSLWLYIEEYCPYSSTNLCSIMYQATWNNSYLSPVFFINSQGKLHLQMSTLSGNTLAALSGFSLPRLEWFRLTITFTLRTWEATVNSGEGFKNMLVNSYEYPAAVFYDDTMGVHVFGGMDSTPTFKGYIGQATVYRNKYISPENIPLPSPFHPMFELGLYKKRERCQGFFDWVLHRLEIHRMKRKAKLFSTKCYNYFEAIRKERNIREYQCATFNEPRPKNYKFVDKLIKKSAYSLYPLEYQPTGQLLYEKAAGYMDEGIAMTRKVIPMLKQSSCFGNLDAMFMLSVIYNNGLSTKVDEIQSHAYLLMSALKKHRLSNMAMAHKHRYGLDGVPLDLEQAYMYYKYVADTSKEDKERHSYTDVMTESVRLTDEIQMKEQTDENGDVFHWLKYQAEKGVLSAQQHVGRALFWGSQGLKRNVQAAVDYFRVSAETEDPQAMYDYGIVLYKGHGGSKGNETEGLRVLQKSAEKNNPAAMNTLGWVALNVEKNVSEGVRLFEKSFSMGNPDAAFNLGIMHLNGQIPGKPADADVALRYFSFAATRNQIDAGIYVASTNIKGTLKMQRNVNIAVEWARFIAEQNPAIGMVLRKGLHAYRNGNIQSAIFYYMMAADTGIEVGTFNLAWLCEENQEGVITYIQKECQWRHFNVSTQREPHFVDSYSLIKMGDYYWYGCGGQQNQTKAADFYSRAARKGDPHAIFNLGFMLEEGADIPHTIWQDINIPVTMHNDSTTILTQLYTRCKESLKTEAYLPCTMALYRLHALQLWEQYHLPIQVVSYIAVVVITLCSVKIIISNLRRPRTQNFDEV